MSEFRKIVENLLAETDCPFKKGDYVKSKANPMNVGQFEEVISNSNDRAFCIIFTPGTMHDSNTDKTELALFPQKIALDSLEPATEEEFIRIVDTLK